MNKRRDQPAGLRQHKAAEAEATVSLIDQALAVLTQQQSDLTAEQRRFRTMDIIAVAAQLRPDAPPIARSTLINNLVVKELIASARGQRTELIFERYSNWTSPRGSSERQPKRRRLTLLSWPREGVARHLAGLEDLEQFLADRRHQIESVLMTSPTWPDDLPYPLQRYTPTAAATTHYKRYLRTHTMATLVESALELEGKVAAHQAHLVLLDHCYIAPLLQTDKKVPEKRCASWSPCKTTSTDFSTNSS